MSHTKTTDFPIRTCNQCGNVLIFTYTCTSESDDVRNLDLKLNNDGQMKFNCRACRSVQIMDKNELVCSRMQLCNMLKIRESALSKVLPEHPRPRQFGDAGKVTINDLRPIMGTA